MERSLIIELIHRTKSTLNTIDRLTQLSREKFEDKQFRQFFYKAISKDIEKHNLVLNTFLRYIQSTTPIPKSGTLIKLIEEGLKKHEVGLEEKRIRIFKQFEKDPPETIVPDEQLKFILDSLFQYAVVLMPSDGEIEFRVKSVPLPRDSIEGQEFLKRGGKCIEIVIAFTGYRKPMAQSGKESGPPSLQQEVSSDLVYRLVEMTVNRNQGTIEFKVDETGSKNTIILRFPIERRKVVYYQLTNDRT